MCRSQNQLDKLTAFCEMLRTSGIDKEISQLEG